MAGTAGTLGFDVLNRKFEEYISQTDDSGPGSLERWSFRAALVAAAISMLSGSFLSGKVGLYAAAISVVIELVGMGTSVVLMLKREVPRFRRGRAIYAESLERDYRMYGDMLYWLDGFSKSEVSARLRYISTRKRLMTFRAGLVLGGLERLGVLPVLVALYFQFRDWKWGDWDSLASVNLVEGLLIFAIFTLYFMGWHLASLRTRLDSLEALLTESEHRLRPDAVV